jgi:hypothetical protein
MPMADNITDVHRRIVGFESITNKFGCWPSFHDSEIAELNLFSGGVEKGGVVTLRLVFWKMSSRVGEKGYFELEHVSLGSFRFEHVEDLELVGFQEGNILFGLEIEAAGELFSVVLNSVYGVSGSFKCRKIEVLELIPWVYREPIGSALKI